MQKNVKLDMKAYKIDASKECYICNIVRGGDKRQLHPILYEDDNVIAFLNMYPQQEGQSIVCPKNHARHIFTDVTTEEYLHVHTCAKRIGEATQKAMNAERMYMLSLGSNELIEHVHLHIFPLPHNIPLEHQQIDAMNHEKHGYIKFSIEEAEETAAKIRSKMWYPGQESNL